MAVKTENIGKYKIEEVVARGGMGVVYKAMHPNLKHQVVIKKLTIRGNKPVLERFKREARLLLELQHLNIVRMFDYFTEGSSHYIVLEFVDGMSLDKLLKKSGKFAWQTALLVIRDSCKALQFAHSKGIIHRDIKPSNILISQKGEIKLADFGIASTEKESDTENDITQVGVTLGTPAYMPPEQFEDSKNVDARADIYSMGVMLYEMIAGKKPFSGNIIGETLLQIQKGQYAPVGTIEKTLPRCVKKLIKRMMHTKPQKRYKDVSSILKIIHKILETYDKKALRVSLVKLMLLDKYTEPTFVPKNKGTKKIIGISVASVVFFAGLWYAWNEGFIHNTVLRRIYTPITVTLETSKTSAISTGVPMSALFFYNDQADIPTVENSFRIFKKDHEKDDSEVYITKPLYVRPGMYRVKVIVGSDVIWKSLKVDKEAQNIVFDIHTTDTRNLNVITSSFDMNTGEDITSRTDFFVKYDGEWTPIQSLTNGELKTGSILQIRAESDGYVTEVFSLLIEWYQDELRIEALMVRE